MKSGVFGTERAAPTTGEMATTVENNDNIPQWKKDLIARLRNQNKKAQTSHHHQQQQQQQRPAPPAGRRRSSSPEAAAAATATAAGGQQDAAMVQEQRTWCRPDPAAAAGPPGPTNGYAKDQDSDQEDLHYGPGIVHRLRNKYLSLALRETAARPSVLRKAASLEHLLDDGGDAENAHKGTYEKATNGVQLRGRYRPRIEMKRARSVETISRLGEDTPHQHVNNRQSLHEEVMLQNTKNNLEDLQIIPKANRPKRLMPLVGESEKPPPDFVKQAKMLFEKRPESRTKRPTTTGDVAAKVEEFNSIIVKAKVASKKPPIKHCKPTVEKSKNNKPVAKPVVIGENTVKPKSLDLKNAKKKQEPSLPSPIPDVSRIDHKKNEDKANSTSSLSETPDLILTSSPMQNVVKKQHLEAFIREERISSSPTSVKPLVFEEKPKILSPTKVKNGERVLSPAKSRNGSPMFGFNKVPTTEPLKVEVNGFVDNKPTLSPRLSPRILQTARQLTEHGNENNDGSLTIEERSDSVGPDWVTVREKRATVADTVVTVNETSVTVKEHHRRAVSEVVNESVVVPVKKPKRRNEEGAGAAVVFNFTGRRDVPDYIANDTSRRPAKPDMPKAGDGGVILLPWAAAGAAAAADDDEALRSLEGPPSPCDVAFVNDNVLIDGRSSLVGRRTRRTKLQISFVDGGPDIFEYPSESSLLEDVPASPVQQLGHSVPTLSGSTLADYIPKTMDDFEWGAPRGAPGPQPDRVEASDADLLLEEAEEPITFSSGSNSDMLF